MRRADGLLAGQSGGGFARRSRSFGKRHVVLQRHGVGHQTAQVVSPVERYACGFEPEGGIARCRNDDPHELREVAVRRRRLRRERFDLPGEGLLAESCRTAEKFARPAVEYGQMRRQVERPAAEDVNGLV